MKILVYGATGNQMRPLIAQCLERGHEPFILSRRLAMAGSFPAGARAVIGDLGDPASLRAANRKMDAVVFMLPAALQHPENTLVYVADAAAAATAAGVKLMVWNTSGHYPLPGENRESGKLLQSIDQILQSCGVPLTVIAPAKYMENLLGPWTLDRIADGVIAYPVLPERRMGWIACRDVCALMLAALERPHLAGRVYRVSGLEAPTGPELAALFSAILNRNFKFITLTPDQMKRSLEAAFGPGTGDAVAAEYALDQADPNPPPTFYDMSVVLKDLPVTMTSLREWINLHRREFMPQQSPD